MKKHKRFATNLAMNISNTVRRYYFRLKVINTPKNRREKRCEDTYRLKT